jgi:hypothetical protein
MNRLRQFIFTGATIPKTIASAPGNDALATISEWFLGSIRHVRTSNCHKVSQMVEQEWLDLGHDSASSASLNTQCKLSEDQELNLLVDVVKRSLEVLRH